MKHILIVISVIIGIYLIIVLPTKYQDIFKERAGYIYHPESDNLYAITQKRKLDKSYTWSYLIPFKKIPTDSFSNELECIEHIGSFKQLIKENNNLDFKKIEIENISKENEKNKKRKYVNWIYNYGYFFPRLDLEEDELTKIKSDLLKNLEFNNFQQGIDILKSQWVIRLIIHKVIQVIDNQNNQLLENEVEIITLDKALFINSEIHYELFKKIYEISYEVCDFDTKFIYYD